MRAQPGSEAAYHNDTSIPHMGETWQSRLENAKQTLRAWLLGPRPQCPKCGSEMTKHARYGWLCRQ
jgi:hypothetical protein